MPVDVRVDLHLDAASGRQVQLSGTGSRLLLAVPGWTELQQFGPRSLRAKRRSLAALIRVLGRLDLTLDVNVNGRRAFGFGTGAKTSLLARLLGLKSADIRVSSILSLLRT